MKPKIVISGESIIGSVIVGGLSGGLFALGYPIPIAICIGLGFALFILLVYYIENN